MTFPLASLFQNRSFSKGASYGSGYLAVNNGSRKNTGLLLPAIMLFMLPLISSATDKSTLASQNNSALHNFSLTEIHADKVPTVGLIYGINIGSYFASPTTANYYNGSGEHSVEAALNRHYNRDRLISNVDEIISSFEIGDLPQNMLYDPGLLIGFFGGFRFGKSFAVIGEFNYSRLTARDKFTLITDKFTSTSEPYRLLSDIYGVEERNEIRLGFQYTLYGSSYIHPFIESGLNLTNTKVIENRVNISGLQFNIREIRSSYYQIRDYGIGFGVYTGVGLHMEVSDNFSFRMGGSVSLSRINLGDNHDIAPLYTAFLRLNLDEVFSSAQR